MSPLPSKEYIKQVEQEVERFDRKGLHATFWHEELAKIREMQEKAERKETKKEIEPDGE